jgi:protein TonB
MKPILLLIFLIISAEAFPQTDTTTYGYVNGTLIQAEIIPCYPGGPQSWKRFLNNNSQYPTSGQQSITGKVTVAFTVNKVGKTSKYEVIKSANPELDQEALRLIKKSGNWVPAIMNGEQVIYRQRIEIEFSQ